MVKKYQKKPICVQAIQIKKDNCECVRGFIKERFGGIVRKAENTPFAVKVFVQGGVVVVPEHDYIVKYHGNFYPAKQYEFEDSYDTIEEQEKIKPKYYWEFDDCQEVWYNSCDSIEECIQEAKYESDEETDCVFIGVLDKPYKPVIDAESVIDRLIEDAYEECGESSDGWLDGVSKEQIQELESALNGSLLKWLKGMNCMPHFGCFSNMWKYDIETGKKVEPGGK